MDGTSFENIGPHAISEILGKLGFQKSGRENPLQWNKVRSSPADLFIGVVYYQKLHHMVADKMHHEHVDKYRCLHGNPLRDGLVVEDSDLARWRETA